MTHEHLVRIGAKWLRKKTEGNIIVPNCNLVTEMKVANKSGEIADIIGWCSFASIMIEVKVSRADFLQDSKKIFRKENCLGVGDFRYFLCPEGVIKEEDLNKRWGLLYCTDIYNYKRKTKRNIETMNTSAEKCRDCKHLFNLRKHLFNREPFKGKGYSGLYACIVEHELDNNHTGHLFTDADGKCEMFTRKKEQ